MTETDPTALCIEILQRALPGVPVSSELPFALDAAPVDGQLIQVAQTGGTRNAVLMQPLMSILCWAASDAMAYALAADCAHILTAAARGPKLTAVRMQNLSRDTWTADGASRYRLNVELYINY